MKLQKLRRIIPYTASVSLNLHTENDQFLSSTSTYVFYIFIQNSMACVIICVDSFQLIYVCECDSNNFYLGHQYFSLRFVHQGTCLLLLSSLPSAAPTMRLSQDSSRLLFCLFFWSLYQSW